jgi:hypothetical protein
MIVCLMTRSGPQSLERLIGVWRLSLVIGYCWDWINNTGLCLAHDMRKIQSIGQPTTLDLRAGEFSPQGAFGVWDMAKIPFANWCHQRTVRSCRRKIFLHSQQRQGLISLRWHAFVNPLQRADDWDGYAKGIFPHGRVAYETLVSGVMDSRELYLTCSSTIGRHEENTFTANNVPYDFCLVHNQARVSKKISLRS